MSDTEQDPAATEPSDKDNASRRALIYWSVLVGSFTIVGVIFTLYAFPELSPLRAIFAGVCFGVFSALCSINYSSI